MKKQSIVLGLIYAQTHKLIMLVVLTYQENFSHIILTLGIFLFT